MQRFIFIVLILLTFILALLAWIKQPILIRFGFSSVPQADSAALERHTRMLSETFVPRDFTHPENLNAAADYIRTEFEKTGGIVGMQPYDVRGETYQNVILELGPTLDESGAVIVLGAHYDAYEALPGADDNASGVAGLIELSRMLAQLDLTKTVQLVAYTLEEPPFFNSDNMGSAVHATALHDQEAPIELMISIEMIGYFSEEPGSQRYPVEQIGWVYPTVGNFITVIGRFDQGGTVREVKRHMLHGADLPIEAMVVPTTLFEEVNFSDHLNYWRYDYPAVMITDTAFFRNFAYHTANDTADRLDYDRMAQVVSGIFEVVKAKNDE